MKESSKRCLQLRVALLKQRWLVETGMSVAGGAVHALPSTEFTAKHGIEGVMQKLRGTPYFSLDVSGVGGEDVRRALEKASGREGGEKLEFVDGRAAMGSLSQFDSAVFSEARSLVDWTARNKVRSRGVE